MMHLQPEFAGFFEHVRRGQLCFPHCRACGHFHWYPMPRCPHCRSADWHWQRVSGTGEIYSFTIVRHAFAESRRDGLPYVVALVVFPDAPGVRLVTNIADADAATLRIGQHVEPVFPTPDDSTGRIVFRFSADKGRTQ